MSEDVVPSTLVLRLLLHPANVSDIAVGLEHLGQFLVRQRVEPLQRDDGQLTVEPGSLALLDEFPTHLA